MPQNLKVMTSELLSKTDAHLAHPSYFREKGRAHKLRMAQQQQHMNERKRKILAEIQEQINSPHTTFSKLHCPECDNPFHRVMIEEQELDYCRHCASCWLFPHELSTITGQPKDIPSEDRKSRPSHYNCPECNEQMQEHVFLTPYFILVNRCVHGHGVYLEDHVLERIFEIC